MRRVSGQDHNIEGAFVLVLFAVFAVTVVAVLALGANSYRSLVTRDNEAYNRRIITSYVAAKIRDNDQNGTIAVGGFANADSEDGIRTLHLYKDIDGELFDQRVYYYEGKIYELFTLADNDLDPSSGNEIMDAAGLDFEVSGDRISIKAIDTDQRENHTVITVRSGIATPAERRAD